MKDLIVNSLELICKIGFVLMLIVGVFGFFGCLAQGHFLAALGCLALTFVMGVLAFGGIFLLLEMNDNLRAIRKSLDEKK